jgi:hypothetical protein
MLWYNVLLNYRHGLPVRSVAMLLRPKADGPAMTGQVRHAVADEQYLDFRYRIVRIWQLPVDTILAGGVGTLPLAPLASVSKSELPAVLLRMEERISAGVPPAEKAVLWTEAFLLMGLHYDPETARELLKGVRAMEESLTYQWIVEKGMAQGMEKGKAEGLAQGMTKGAAEEAQRILLRMGTKEFGAPDAATNAVIAAMDDRDRLEALIERVGEVKSWQELLAPPSRRRNGRKRK